MTRIRTNKNDNTNNSKGTNRTTSRARRTDDETDKQRDQERGYARTRIAHKTGIVRRNPTDRRRSRTPPHGGERKEIRWLREKARHLREAREGEREGRGRGKEAPLLSRCAKNHTNMVIAIGREVSLGREGERTGSRDLPPGRLNGIVVIGHLCTRK